MSLRKHDHYPTQESFLSIQNKQKGNHHPDAETPQTEQNTCTTTSPPASAPVLLTVQDSGVTQAVPTRQACQSSLRGISDLSNRMDLEEVKIKVVFLCLNPQYLTKSLSEYYEAHKKEHDTRYAMSTRQSFLYNIGTIM